MTDASDGPKCDKCGVECTTGMMAAFCSNGRACEFWPHSNGDVTLAGGELLMYRFWMDNTLEQIGLQIDERKRLEREVESLNRLRKLLEEAVDSVDGEDGDPPRGNAASQVLTDWRFREFAEHGRYV